MYRVLPYLEFRGCRKPQGICCKCCCCNTYTSHTKWFAIWRRARNCWYRHRGRTENSQFLGGHGGRSLGSCERWSSAWVSEGAQSDGPIWWEHCRACHTCQHCHWSVFCGVARASKGFAQISSVCRVRTHISIAWAHAAGEATLWTQRLRCSWRSSSPAWLSHDLQLPVSLVLPKQNATKI